MRILFDYLPGVGGEAVAESMRRSPQIRRSFAINTTDGVREFAAMTPAARSSRRLVYGLKAGGVANIMPPGTTRVTLICDPAERIARAYEHYRNDASTFLHPICKAHPIEAVVEMVPEFRDLYAQQFDPRLYDIIATDPFSLLAALGITEPLLKIEPEGGLLPVIAKRHTLPPAAAMKHNGRDSALWQHVKSQSDVRGAWRPGVLPNRDQKPPGDTRTPEKPRIETPKTPKKP